MFKKLLALVLALTMVSAFAVAEETRQVINLGTSGLAMVIDSSYVKSAIDDDDTSQGEVGYYASEKYETDFDIYQWGKADEVTLASVAAEEAALYDTEYTKTEYTETEINGIPACCFDSVDEFEGVEYKVTVVILLNGDTFAEIIFWMGSEEGEANVKEMISTISAIKSGEMSTGGRIIRLGNTSLKITTPYVYTKSGLNTDDTSDAQVAYYVSEETYVDFDVYQWAKYEGETLADAAAEEAAQYGAEPMETEINGIYLAYYRTVAESEGYEYDTVTYMAEDGDTIVEIVIWLAGENAEETADAIIGSITR